MKKFQNKMESNRAKRKRQVNVYHKCCATLVENVVSAVQEEKRDGELKFGLTRASDL